jgi:hypothetical protein
MWFWPVNWMSLRPGLLWLTLNLALIIQCISRFFVTKYLFFNFTHTVRCFRVSSGVRVHQLEGRETVTFITVFTRAFHRSLFWTGLIQYIQHDPVSLRSILIISTQLRLWLPSRLSPSGSPTDIQYPSLFSPYLLDVQPISFTLTWPF